LLATLATKYSQGKNVLCSYYITPCITVVSVRMYVLVCCIIASPII